MQIRFLLGPAGSGKTFRCLSEIRDALSASPDGLPLILLAPKQATFQLERQLLSDSTRRLPGYTRLHIVSFEHLARFIFDQLERPVPELLSEEGRVMVLRALLEQKRHELRLFRASTRLPGFARQLSQILRELQQYHLSPERLESLATKIGDGSHLEAKLHDFALILRSYVQWLQQHELEDADRLLDLAAEELSKSAKPTAALDLALRTSHLPLRIESLWLDGFAQLTPQERRLLAALAPSTCKTTLCFCLENATTTEPPWHSIWAPVASTFSRCREEFQALPEAEVLVETLPRIAGRNRFQEQPMLQYFEQHLAGTVPGSGFRVPSSAGDSAEVQTPNSTLKTQNSKPKAALRLVACASPEAEVEFAARGIHRYVRESGGRFRDTTVLVRSLEPYHHLIRRIFSRYAIPFFLDRREPVAHHPLAELTRYAIRLTAFGWEHDDWFGALKTGLVHEDDAAIDRLENEALARGWRGRNFWLEPLPVRGTSDPGREQLERLRQKLVEPFQQFSDSIAAALRNPTGSQLAAAIRQLWKQLGVDRQLEAWTASTRRLEIENWKLEIHRAVWTQLLDWLKNLELAFSGEALSLNEWLAILEAGLGQLSVGAIPPALDQVLVGAVDRSRNPDLQLAFVLGLNEGIFPAPPPAPLLLNWTERETLASHSAIIGATHLQQISFERYLGYIACTRARQGVILTWASRDADGQELKPSPMINDVRRLFPDLEPEAFPPDPQCAEAEHWSELTRGQFLTADSTLRSLAPELDLIISQCEQITRAAAGEKLPPDLAEKIYGLELHTSVSGLEDFAACPFKFFIDHGLRAEERLEFEINPREKGSFQHEVLREFHLRLEKAGKRWRDVNPTDARQIIREAGESLLPEFREGLFTAEPSRRFTAGILIESLEQLIEVLIEWTKQYQFDPVAVEISFGLSENQLPPWRIDLDERHALLLRGRIDRIDLCRLPETHEALAVVIDYKSSARHLDPVLLHHGLELQLLAYLGALSQFRDLQEAARLSRIIPAGAFYVALKRGATAAGTRQQEAAERERLLRTAYQHRGRFDGRHLDKFDRTGGNKGEQFHYAKNHDGNFSSRGNEALATDAFRSLIKHVEDFLRRHGREIYDGRVAIAPYRWKQETACDFCLHRPICRFDPWTQPFRVLRPPAK